MEHRGTARTRTIRVSVDQSAPEVGVSVTAGDKTIGTMGSAANGRGLALLRTDRASDALDAGLQLSAGGLPITLVAPDDVRMPTKKASA
jgi:folate-binding Fe-S cluster repair protein YgfZ